MDETNSEMLGRERAEMVETIARHFRDTSALTGERELAARVRAAMLAVSRHRFVPDSLSHSAYTDSALPIGFGQTISQPFIVALMVQLSRIGPGARVLEVGTGSGYEAAILSELAEEVYTIELVPELATRARTTLEDLGYRRVQVRCSDGFDGWPEAAPFDAILVTACAHEMPRPLVAQLAPNGRMIIPVGRPNAYQELQVVRSTGDAEHEVQHVLPVAFVPFVHDPDRDEGDAGPVRG
jgi:protein-L-isoaspartate(D-aspartate) O-methyltransferase